MKYLIPFLALAFAGPIVITTPIKAESLNPATNNAQARSQPPLTHISPNANVSTNNQVEDGSPVCLRAPKTRVPAFRVSPGNSDPSGVTNPAMKRQNNIVPPLPPITVTRVKQGPAPN